VLALAFRRNLLYGKFLNRLLIKARAKNCSGRNGGEHRVRIASCALPSRGGLRNSFGCLNRDRVARQHLNHIVFHYAHEYPNINLLDVELFAAQLDNQLLVFLRSDGLCLQIYF